MEWNEHKALEFLARAGYRPDGQKTFILNKDDAPGLGAWGAFDYLKGEHGYWVRRS